MSIKDNAIATTESFGDGEIAVNFETDDGEVVTLRTSCANWRRLTQMITHQINVSERRVDSRLLYPMGNA